MKNKHFGFTLIELLVVIVIIGILATISTATFKSYFGKARDAERQSAVQNMALMVKVDGADEWGPGKFIYDHTTESPVVVPNIKDLFDANDFRLPKGTNNICYIMAMGKTAGTIGDDNEFAFAAWGESTSTKTTGDAGILVDGTSAFVDALKDATLGTAAGQLAVGDFSCDGSGFGDVRDVVNADGVGADDLVNTYLYIDSDGVVDDNLAA